MYCYFSEGATDTVLFWGYGLLKLLTFNQKHYGQIQESFPIFETVMFMLADTNLCWMNSWGMNVNKILSTVQMLTGDYEAV